MNKRKFNEAYADTKDIIYNKSKKSRNEEKYDILQINKNIIENKIDSSKKMNIHFHFDIRPNFSVNFKNSNENIQHFLPNKFFGENMKPFSRNFFGLNTQWSSPNLFNFSTNHFIKPVEKPVKRVVERVIERVVEKEKDVIISEYYINKITKKKEDKQIDYYSNGQIKYVKIYKNGYLIKLSKYNRKYYEDNILLCTFNAKEGEFITFTDNNISKNIPIVEYYKISN